MDKQFWVHSQKITQSGFKINNKDSMYDSALIKRMKYQNYLIFQPQLVEKKVTCPFLYNKSKSIDNILFQARRYSRIKKNRISNHSVPTQIDQSQNKSLQLKAIKNSHVNIFRGSLNRILTRACITRNQRKKEKLLANKSKSSHQTKSPKLRGQSKQIVSRDDYFDYLSRKSKEKYSLDDTKNKLFFKITKKKKKLTKLVKFQQRDKQISGWEFQNDSQFQQL